MSTIVTNNLTKRYGRRTGVEDVNLSVPQAAVFGFLGPNGSGKTTTIRLLLGFLKPSKGGATLLGEDCWRRAHHIKKDVGYVPGDLRLYAWMTVRRALKIWGQVRCRDLVTPGLELAELFDLEPDVRVRNMSRGMRQKLGIILALVHKPKLLILDEPTASLDPLIQQTFHKVLRERARQGHTIFLSSHTLSEVQDLCDRVVILRNGRLVADETVNELRTRATRQVMLRWSKDVDDLPPPVCLTITRRDKRQWECTLSGEVMDLVRWSANQPINDLSIGRPDLDSVFRSYYQDRSGDP